MNPTQHRLLAFPSLTLALGYLLFYSQLALGWWVPQGSATYLLSAIAAAVLAAGFLVGAGLAFQFARLTLAEAKDRERLGVAIVLSVLGLLLGCALFSALKPAHLPQESDFANYHLLLPKQNWLFGNWRPVEWSPYAHLGLLVQYGLSFLWVGLPLLNKLPQLLFLLFLLLRIWAIPSLFGVPRPAISGLLAVTCFLAFRGVAIQVGMAMLDLTMLYFLVALASFFLASRSRSADSALALLAGVDLAAYLGHKSFGFIFAAVIAISAEASFRFFLKRGLFFLPRSAWFWVPTFAMFVPNVVRAFYYAGDPFFPVFLRATQTFCDDAHLAITTCAEVVKVALRHQNVVYQYGYGHGPVDFLKTALFLGLAKDGPTPVNSIFDYPLGIFWYSTIAMLALAPLLRPSLKPSAKALGMVCGIFFCVWFAGSQQSRWLYPVLAALSLFWGCALVQLLESRQRLWIPAACVALSLLLVGINSARVIRSQRGSLACFGESCLGEYKDYRKDYRMVCPEEPLKIGEKSDRGYINCKIGG